MCYFISCFPTYAVVICLNTVVYCQDESVEQYSCIIYRKLVKSRHVKYILFKSDLILLYSLKCEQVFCEIYYGMLLVCVFLFLRMFFILIFYIFIINIVRIIQFIHNLHTFVYSSLLYHLNQVIFQEIINDTDENVLLPPYFFVIIIHKFFILKTKDKYLLYIFVLRIKICIFIHSSAPGILFYNPKENITSGTLPSLFHVHAHVTEEKYTAIIEPVH